VRPEEATVIDTMTDVVFTPEGARIPRSATVNAVAIVALLRTLTAKSYASGVESCHALELQ
jgi:hypothetical protein